MTLRRRAVFAVAGVSVAVLGYALLDWRRPILPIRSDTPRRTT